MINTATKRGRKSEDTSEKGGKRRKKRRRSTRFRAESGRIRKNLAPEYTGEAVVFKICRPVLTVNTERQGWLKNAPAKPSQELLASHRRYAGSWSQTRPASATGEAPKTSLNQCQPRQVKLWIFTLFFYLFANKFPLFLYVDSERRTTSRK